MNEEYAKAFGDAANEVFSTMLNVTVTAGPARLTDPATLSLYVSGIIGMSGDVVGVAALALPLESARKVVAHLTDGELCENDEDFADAIGEMINMITGVAKSRLRGRTVSISCPSVVVGHNHKLFQRKNKPVLEIPCRSECGNFSVLVWTTDCPSAVTATGVGSASA